MTTLKIMNEKALEISKTTLLFVFFIALLNITGISPPQNVYATEIEEKAYNDVIKELRAKGHPAGLFGATWHMTQQEVKNLSNNYSQLNNNILVQEKTLYDRPVQVSYHFRDNRLMIIVISFKDNFRSPKELSNAYNKVQHHLSLDFGQMPEPTMHDIIPPSDNKWTDQEFIVSEKRMGRTTLIHRIKIQRNSAGEQLIMYLSKKDN